MTSVLDLVLRPLYARIMTSDLDSSKESRPELQRRRVFRVRLWVGVVCYLIASFVLYQWGQGSNPWRLVLAVLPILFVAWMVLVIVLRVRQLDEYQVKLLFPGLAVGFTVTLFAAVAVGTLNAAGFNVPNAGWPIALIGIVAWEFTNLLNKAPNA